MLLGKKSIKKSISLTTNNFAYYEVYQDKTYKYTGMVILQIFLFLKTSPYKPTITKLQTKFSLCRKGSTSRLFR